jgi:hypothetical protein
VIAQLNTKVIATVRSGKILKLFSERTLVSPVRKTWTPVQAGNGLESSLASPA